MSDHGSIRSLPASPDRRFLKLEAKRRLAAGEFGRLHEAQFAIAREHGFTSWARLTAHIDLLRLTTAERADAFVRSACSSDPRAALALLVADPEIASASGAAALCAGDFGAAGGLDPTVPLAPLGWPPLLYATFLRLLRVSPRHAPGIQSCVAALLEQGADPSAIVEMDEGASGADIGHRLTPIYGAVGVNNDPEVTRALLAAGADPDEGLGQADPDDPNTGWAAKRCTTAASSPISPASSRCSTPIPTPSACRTASVARSTTRGPSIVLRSSTTALTPTSVCHGTRAEPTCTRRRPRVGPSSSPRCWTAEPTRHSSTTTAGRH